MASLDFPSNPTNNQTYALNGVTYYYNAAIGAWLTQLSTMNLSTSSNTQVLFNDAGLANGSSGFTFNKAANTLIVNQIGGPAGNVITASFAAANSAYAFTWDTVIKTSAFTASSNTGYFVNTTSGAVVVNLPAAPTVGSRITVVDYAGTSATNNIVLNLNGLKMNGITANGSISSNRASFEMIYVDSTQGWVNFSSYIQTTPGQTYSVEFLIVAGGGGGAGYHGAGGGAGGYIDSTATLSAVTSYSVTVGGGGAAGPTGSGSYGSNGNSSSLGSLATATGGGAGAYSNAGGTAGQSGGSGGGGAASGGSGGSGTAGQGNAGGAGSGTGGSTEIAGGGGGGAGAAGSAAPGTTTGGNGGAGLNWKSLGTLYAGGGGGRGQATKGSGGTGGGGAGEQNSSASTAGGTNTGGGGGGGHNTGVATGGKAGGSGIVIIRYLGAQRGTGGTYSSAGGYSYHTFTSSSTYTA